MCLEHFNCCFYGRFDGSFRPLRQAPIPSLGVRRGAQSTAAVASQPDEHLPAWRHSRADSRRSTGRRTRAYPSPARAPAATGRLTRSDCLDALPLAFHPQRLCNSPSGVPAKVHHETTGKGTDTRECATNVTGARTRAGRTGGRASLCGVS